MGLSRWGDRVDQKLSASKGLSPAEHVTEMARKIEQEATVDALAKYARSRLPLATVKCWVEHVPNVLYILEISIVVKEQVFLTRRRITDPELTTMTTSSTQYQAFMKKVLREAAKEIQMAVLDRYGIRLGVTLRDEDANGWANMTNVTAANLTASSVQATQAMSRFSAASPSPMNLEDDAKAEAAARASIEETLRSLKKK